MSDPSDDAQDLAEALDSDKVGTPDDTVIEPDYPFDQLLGADDYGLTAAEEEIDEPLVERIRRESPDPLAVELDDADERPADDITPDVAELELALDDDTLAVLDRIEPLTTDDAAAATDAELDAVGRLVEPGVDQDVLGLDDEAQSVATAFDEQDLSAEEAAVHLTDEPPM